MKLKDKVVIITGASSGIGKALAIEFAQRGVNLVLAARQYVTLCGIAQQLQTDYNIKAIAVQCDVAVEDDCAALVKQTLLTFGKIDVLINNAGISMRALFKDVDLQVMKNLMDVNFWGTVYCTKHALPAIIKTHGSIVGISSVAGYKGLPGRAGYSASKYAMNGFLDALRVENLRTGVHIMVACPGFTASNIRNTALDKNGRQQGESTLEEDKMMTAEVVARLIANGVENRSRTLIMTFQGKLTVFLSKFLPAFLDKQVFKVFAREKNALLK
ncbi:MULTISPECIES: SDR family oxidoreductase [unclassified Mucilaginibacter]|uniref:SDR family oxidoreductase n=1 Tax=unclassified Mucilaginibacter TaxID=2617802 RepID=UPI002AC8FB9D|nr:MULTISPECIES: SDR family oxidoreductase [unclassified Mucilaginibacter]MEB0262313.1 SDR family oxidoreductase [Mucilaginibacter sp. 10I4]MEB0279960.1 SDR family oxidoreductase [Mucilaginibacter sp. 10B2]MEB0301798.1 SDR family oxidoreductase [Mucilaginibacter sp. 5C4]WPX21918.1 SDR family oxidoreductase [Mucilaginibacter sp. 5C4]